MNFHLFPTTNHNIILSFISEAFDQQSATAPVRSSPLETHRTSPTNRHHLYRACRRSFAAMEYLAGQSKTILQLAVDNANHYIMYLTASLRWWEEECIALHQRLRHRNNRIAQLLARDIEQRSEMYRLREQINALQHEAAFERLRAERLQNDPDWEMRFQVDQTGLPASPAQLELPEALESVPMSRQSSARSHLDRWIIETAVSQQNSISE